MREIRSEVNAYASAILARLLTIVHEVPGAGRDDIERIEREIQQMLTFVDPTSTVTADARSARVNDIPFTADSDVHVEQPTGSAVNDRLDSLIEMVDRASQRSEASNELLREVRVSLYTLRDELSTQHEATTQALQLLTSTTRSLHYTITALSARSEKVTDLSGVAREELRVGVWQYALIAGVSGGAIVAAIVAFLSLVI